MKRALFFLFVLSAGCLEVDKISTGPVTVSLSLTPSSLTRPCLLRSKVAVFDDQGTEYRVPEGTCNEGSITLPLGRSFVGAELTSDQVAAFSVYVSE